MKHIYSSLKMMLLTALLLLSGNMKAEDIVYDFLSAIPDGWTASADPNGYETTGTARGTQFITNATLTLPGVKDATKVVITCSCNNSAEGNSIAVSVGGNTWGTEGLLKVTDSELTFTGSASGDLVISITRSNKSVWVKKVVVTCGEAGCEGGEGGDKDDDDPIVTPPADIEHITIAEFLNNADPETTYELTGTVKNITSTKYGNFDLVEGDAQIYIYGLLDKEGKAQNFASLGIAEGDEVTLTGVYYLFTDKEGNSKPEIKNAKFVSLKKGEGGEGGEEGDDTGDQTELDPNYNYAEPTTVVAAGELGSNKTYTFINNNIKVQTSVGAITESYFGCNAGQTITFTATKPIKALLVNGYVKQNFEAEASAGEVYYVDASESEVTADPVLAVLDIDNTTVTINCVKQLRCYNVSFYFDENPEIDLGGGGEDDGDYNHDYEPQVPTNLNITFAELEAGDYSEYYGFDYTDLYFSNDDFEMEVGVFAPMVDGTYIAPGTYQITDTYQPGTVQASPGGDEYYDYPTYIATDFEYIEGPTEEESGWIYNTAYYLVNGTLTVTKLADGVKIVLDAVTYYGTTVHAEYVEGTDEGETGILKAAAETVSSPRKLLKNGKLLIQTGEHTYDATGRIMK